MSQEDAFSQMLAFIITIRLAGPHSGISAEEERSKASARKASVCTVLCTSFILAIPRHEVECIMALCSGEQGALHIPGICRAPWL